MGRYIPESFKEKLKDEIDLREVALKYMTPASKRGTKSHKYFCVFHEDKGDPNLAVYDRKYICFRCRAHGDIFDLVQHFEKCTLDKAIEILSKEFGYYLPNDEGKQVKHVRLLLNSEEYQKFGLNIREMREVAQKNKKRHDQILMDKMKGIANRVNQVYHSSQNQDVRNACIELNKGNIALYNKGLLIKQRTRMRHASTQAN